MAITQLRRAKDHRIFREFTWPTTLYDFGRFNLIYGWNGCGKTTLSEMFKCVEKRAPISEGVVEFVHDGATIAGSSLDSTAGLPRVKVFNRAYVDSNLHLAAAPVSLAPILFLGEENVDKQKQVEVLTTKRTEAEKLAGEKEARIKKTDASLDSFCAEGAKNIKELLSSSPTNSYNYYNKSDFRRRCEALSKPGVPSAALTPERRAELKQKKEERPKEALARLTNTLPDLEEIRKTVSGLLDRTVLSKVIESLAKDSDASTWVETGLRLHTGDRKALACRFCGGPLRDERIAELEAHFNDAYGAFLVEIDTAIGRIAAARRSLDEIALPAKAEFYDAHAGSYAIARDSFLSFRSEADAFLREASDALSEKRKKPFERATFSGPMIPQADKGRDAMASINALVDAHNQDTADFQKIVTEARSALEGALAAEALPTFEAKLAAVNSAKEEARAARETAQALAKQIDELEKEIVEHRKPAEQLNEELRSYLGRDELKFEFKDTGYLVTRHGEPALNLSEGERTAIAFLYFLKTLQDKGFSLKDDIVVIDDPVSSLDANALFCAFGYMKERTKAAGQMFVLTHNFGLFRQVKNWFSFVNRGEKDEAKHKARFYMIDTEIMNGVRNARLSRLDALLYKFESEYHYLFKKVYDCASEDAKGKPLEGYYAMPNIARRLLESFLSFRFPALAGHLAKQLDEIAYDAGKKARVLRFLHTYSHDGKIAEAEHDLSILSETPQIMKDVLGIMRVDDAKHYDAMVELVNS